MGVGPSASVVQIKMGVGPSVSVVQIKGVVYAKQLEYPWHVANIYKLLALTSNRLFFLPRACGWRGCVIVKGSIALYDQQLCTL